jgi:rare lipoprotein A
VSRTASALLALVLALAGCVKPPPAGNPHYVSGDAWQAEGVWHYPSQSFELDETGLAAIYGPDHPQLTTNGAVFDPAALTGAHQVLQLPAIARLTNLETGLQLMLRINDRGPPSPARMLAVTPRVATLLEFPPTGVARVRLEVLQAESRDATEAVQGGNAANLDVATAPRAGVQQEALAPPPGIRDAGRPAGSPRTDGADATAAPAAQRAVQRLPETVSRIAPAPGQLWLRLGSFSRAEFARMQLARVGGLGAQMERIRNGRTIDYRVIIGPYNRVSDADAALARVIGAGITDARIVIEPGS